MSFHFTGISLTVEQVHRWYERSLGDEQVVISIMFLIRVERRFAERVPSDSSTWATPEKQVLHFNGIGILKRTHIGWNTGERRASVDAIFIHPLISTDQVIHEKERVRENEESCDEVFRVINNNPVLYTHPIQLKIPIVRFSLRATGTKIEP